MANLIEKALYVLGPFGALNGPVHRWLLKKGGYSITAPVVLCSFLSCMLAYLNVLGEKMESHLWNIQLCHVTKISNNLIYGQICLSYKTSAMICVGFLLYLRINRTSVDEMSALSYGHIIGRWINQRVGQGVSPSVLSI